MLRAQGFHLPDEKTNTAPMANAAGILKRGSHCSTLMSDGWLSHISGMWCRTRACFFFFLNRTKTKVKAPHNSRIRNANIMWGRHKFYKLIMNTLIGSIIMQRHSSEAKQIEWCVDRGITFERFVLLLNSTQCSHCGQWMSAAEKAKVSQHELWAGLT